MKEALVLKSKSGIHRLISALEERGFLRRLPNRARALEVLRFPEAAKANGREHRDNVLPLRKPAPALKPIAANDIVEVPLHGDRKRVVEGKRVSVRVDLGGRRIIKKKKKK